MIKKLLIAFALLSAVCFAQPVRNHALATHHTIHAAARPFKAVGHAVAKTVTGAAVFSFEAFDAGVIDPFGVALQTLADGLDMGLAAPLESLPKPLNVIGQGVHEVYLGIDFVGTQLAK
jgi:hypothetical protein